MQDSLGYGQDNCVKNKKEDITKEFVESLENAISYYNTYIYVE